ncbi:MAG TPA: reverse transcriptase domain-containing protein [Sphingomicrobium sp.]|nr:reverse transcriptase domain-containing protein [Sphingomicrobium sp.]
MPLQAQSDYFSEAYLRDLFDRRIAKSRAVGRDGVRLAAFRANLDRELALISKKVLSGEYRFTAYKERLVSRGPNRIPRQLSIPTVRDRLTLRATCDALAAIAPRAVSPPPHSYVKSITETVRTAAKPVSFVRVDVRDFFPSIEHARLLEILKDHGAEPFLVGLIRDAISTPTGISRNESKLRFKGVPQGLSISNLLSSMYMRSVDEGANEGKYSRYVDDILVVCPSHREARVFKDVVLRLQEIGLDAHSPGTEGKSEIKRAAEGIEYLGYRIHPKCVSIRKSSYRKMFTNALRVLTDYRYKQKLSPLLFRLNLKITGCIVDGKRRGWLMFFAQTEDVAQLQYLDRFVARQLKRVGAANVRDQVKRFVKTYHEIRYKGSDSAYIPNFDNFDMEQKTSFVSLMTGTPVDDLRGTPHAYLDEQFELLLSREIEDLEEDVIGAIS